MKNILFCIIIIVMLSSCNQKNRKGEEDGYNLVLNFYNKAKIIEPQLDKFSNIDAGGVRGMYPDSTYRIGQILIDMKMFPDSTNRVPNIITDALGQVIIIKVPKMDGKQSFSMDGCIDLFADLNNFSKDQAIDSLERFCCSVINFMNEFRVYDIHGHQDNFIIFKVSGNFDIIYVPDKSKVDNKYYQEVFSNINNKLDERWYVRKLEKK